MNTISNKETTAISLLQNPVMGLTTVGEYYPKNKVSVSSSNPICSNISNHVLHLLERWQSLLDIQHWVIVCEPIDEMQVLDDLKGDMPGHEFVGIAIDFTYETGIIYHTRRLQEDDIIHELLHVRFPNWSEQKVDCFTNRLIKQSNLRNIKNAVSCMKY